MAIGAPRALVAASDPLTTAPAGDEAGRERLESTYVNASFEAQEALKKARERVRRQDWAGAAAALQQIADKYGHQLFKIDRDRYIGVLRVVASEIASWPVAGVHAYEGVYGGIAADQLAAARAAHDLAGLVAVADRYFATRSGGEALDAAAELAMERGEFAAAIDWYDRLLTLHPDRAERAPEWRVKAALCRAWQGRSDNLKQLVASKEAIPREIQVNWGGSRRSLRSFAEEMLNEVETEKSRKGRPGAGDAARPSIFCGGNDRRGFYESTALPEARLWHASVLPTPEPGEKELDESDSAMHMRAIQSGRLLSSIPASGDDRIYIADGAGVRAFDPERAESPAWNYAASDAIAPAAGWIGEDEPPEQHTVLYHGKRVYAAISFSESQSKALESEDESDRMTAAIVCLNARDGAPVWRRSLNELGTAFEEITLDGAPMFHHGRLYAIARKRKGFGFEACLLVCLEPRDGRLLWATHVGEAATGSYGYSYPTKSCPAAEGDRIYVHSNLGTIAAVSAATGEVDWLVTYVSRFANESEAVWPTRFGRPIRSWQYQPTMLWKGDVVCAPMDLEELLVLDRRDGRIVRRTRMDELFNPETILGIRDDLLYAAGGHVVAFDLSTHGIVWQRPLSESRLFGRGAVTTEGVWIPTASALLKYPLDGGAAVRFPWRMEEAGNILPLSDQMVAVGADVVSGRIERAVAYKRLESQLEQRPEDAGPSLAIAELALSGGDDDRGLAAAADAVNRCGGFDGLTLDSRHRLFDRFLRLAEMKCESDDAKDASADREVLARNLTTASRLIELAGKCAADSDTRVEYGFVLARNCLRRGALSEAVEAYQRLLSDPALAGVRVRMRSQWLPPSEGKAEASIADLEVTVRLAAEERIDALISQHGRQCYEAVASRAAAEFEEIRSTADAGELIRFGARFPNSELCGGAMALAARRAAREGDTTLAIRCFRLALASHQLGDRARVIRELAGLLACDGRTAEAMIWLERGSRDYPDLKFGGENKALSFDELRADLSGKAALPAPDAADVGWPLSVGYQRISRDRATVLSVFESRTNEAPLDLVLAYTDGRVEARNPATGRTIWPKALACENMPILLAADGDRLYMAGANRIFAVARTSGVIGWQFGEDGAKHDGDPEEIESWTDHAVTATSVYSGSDRGDIVCLSRSDGRLNWRRPVEGGTASHLAADDRFVYCAKWRGRHNVIHLFNAKDGEPAGVIQCDDSRPIQAMETTESGVLVVVLSRSILGIDPASASVMWSVATPRHFMVSTFVPDVDGFMIGTDDRRIARYDTRSGRRLWQTEPIGKDDRDSVWIGLRDGRLVAASRDALMAFDSADGALLWTAANSPGIRWQVPTLTTDSVVLIAPVPSESPASAPVPFQIESTPERFAFSRYSLVDGRSMPLTQAGPLVTEPIGSFGGFFVRHRAILVLDGGEVIGYVGSESPAR